MPPNQHPAALIWCKKKCIYQDYFTRKLVGSGGNLYLYIFSDAIRLMESRRTKNEENKPLMYLPFILYYFLENIHLLKAKSKYSLTKQYATKFHGTDNDILVELICF